VGRKKGGKEEEEGLTERPQLNLNFKKKEVSSVMHES
jgi:hypothetical protein